MFAYTTTLRTPSMMPAFTSTSRSRWKSMRDSVRSSIIAATFRVNDRPNAKPNPDASSRSPADPAPRGRLDAGHAFLVFDRRDEAIPATWDGFDVLRSGRGIAERFAQPLDGRVH